MDNKYNDYCILMSVYRKDSPVYLRKSIDSMLNQSINAKQFVIVVDGNISDELSLVLNEYKEKEPALFEIIFREKNMGLGYSLNEGLKYCKYELVARMDSDDISVKNRCELQINRFKENENLEILGGQIYEFEDSIENIIDQRYVPCTKQEIIRFSHRRSPFNHPTVMFKKSSILRCGGYPILNRKEDLGLFIKMVNSGVLCENLNEVILYYRTSKENLKRRKTFINCKEYTEVMYEFYKDNTISLIDLIYVVLGQLTLYLTPTFLTKIISRKLLRNKVGKDVFFNDKL